MAIKKLLAVVLLLIGATFAPQAQTNIGPIGTPQIYIGPYTIAAGPNQLPSASLWLNYITTVTDASSTANCNVGGGGIIMLCIAQVGGWVPLTGSGATTINWDSPGAIGSIAPNTGQFTILNGTAFAAAYAGADCGAKINAALAVSGISEVWVTQAAGSACTTAVSVGAGQTLKFTQAGTWTFAQTITLGADASIKGLPKGDNQAAVVLQEVSGSNLPCFITMSGNRSSIVDVFVDGNKAANSTAHDAVCITGNRVVLDSADVQNAKRHNIYINGAGSCCGRIEGHALVNSAGSDGIYAVGTTDWFINPGIEFEANGANGIEGLDSSAFRVNGTDISGNTGDGIKIGADVSGNAVQWTITNNQMRNNSQNDIETTGVSAYNNYGHVISDNLFDSSSGRTDNTYDSIHLANSGESSVVSNWFGGGGSTRYRYDYFEGGTYSLPSTLQGNTFNLNGAGTGYYSVISATTVGPNNEGNGATLLNNWYMANAQPLQWKDSGGTIRNIMFLDSSNNTNIYGQTAQKQINFIPDPAGVASLVLNSTSIGLNLMTLIKNNTPLQWFNSSGANRTVLLVDSANHTYLIGANADLQLQPVAGATECTVTATGQNCVHGLAINGVALTPSLTGTTGSIGGSPLLAGVCATGTATVTGAIAGHPVSVSASDGTLPNALVALAASVTSSNTVSVQVCAIAAVTPAAKTYNVTTQ